MNRASTSGTKILSAVAAWAYRSLALTFLFFGLMRLSFGDGGWFNEVTVALLLTLPLVVQRLMRLRQADGAS